MTSQLVLMNRRGVSIASDSAITINKDMTFESFDKIFPAKTGTRPVGNPHKVVFMLSGMASFMASGQSFPHIFWKFNNEKLANQEQFNDLEEYADKFVKFLRKGVEDANYMEIDLLIAKCIATGISKFCYAAPLSSSVDVDEIKAIGDLKLVEGEALEKFLEVRKDMLEEFVQAFYDWVPDQIKDTSDLSESQIRIAEAAQKFLADTEEELSKIPCLRNLVMSVVNLLGESRHSRLKVGGGLMLVERHIQGELDKYDTTICIVGYGKGYDYPKLVRIDISPSLVTVDYTSKTVAQLKELLREKGRTVSGEKAELIERLVDGGEGMHLRFGRAVKIVTIQGDQPATEEELGAAGSCSKRTAFMLPFAQRQEMQTVFNGVRNDFRGYMIDKVMKSLIEDFSPQLKKGLIEEPGIGQKLAQKAVEGTMPILGTKVFETMEQSMSNSVLERRDNMRRAVAILPMTELNEFSELMVMIEKQIKHYTEPVRSVGGEIHVAQITLEEGFNWIKKPKDQTH